MPDPIVIIGPATGPAGPISSSTGPDGDGSVQADEQADQPAAPAGSARPSLFWRIAFGTAGLLGRALWALLVAAGSMIREYPRYSLVAAASVAILGSIVYTQSRPAPGKHSPVVNRIAGKFTKAGDDAKKDPSSASAKNAAADSPTAAPAEATGSLAGDQSKKTPIGPGETAAPEPGARLAALPAGESGAERPAPAPGAEDASSKTKAGNPLASEPPAPANSLVDAGNPPATSAAMAGAQGDVLPAPAPAPTTDAASATLLSQAPEPAPAPASPAENTEKSTSALAVPAPASASAPTTAATTAGIAAPSAADAALPAPTSPGLADTLPIPLTPGGASDLPLPAPLATSNDAKAGETTAQTGHDQDANPKSTELTNSHPDPVRPAGETAAAKTGQEEKTSGAKTEQDPPVPPELAASAPPESPPVQSPAGDAGHNRSELGKKEVSALPDVGPASKIALQKPAEFANKPDAATADGNAPSHAQPLVVGSGEEPKTQRESPPPTDPSGGKAKPEPPTALSAIPTEPTPASPVASDRSTADRGRDAEATASRAGSSEPVSPKRPEMAAGWIEIPNSVDIPLDDKADLDARAGALGASAAAGAVAARDRRAHAAKDMSFEPESPRGTSAASAAAAGAGADTEAQKDVAGPRVEPWAHVVERNENFWTISRQYWGSGRYYKALWKANAAKYPDINVLHVGDVIIVPAIEDLDPAFIESPRAAAPSALANRAGRRADAASAGGSDQPGEEIDRSEGSSRPAQTAAAPSRSNRGARGADDPSPRQVSVSDPDAGLPLAESTIRRDRTPSRTGRSLARDDETSDEPEIRTSARPKGNGMSTISRPVHKVRRYETIRSIARDTLGDARRADEILELNRGVIDDPSQLVVGQILELPEDARTSVRRTARSR